MAATADRHPAGDAIDTRLSAPSAASAQAAPSRNSQAKLHRQHDDCIDALHRRDTDWLERHLASDFRAILADGRLLGRAAVLAGDHAALAPAQEIGVQFEGDVALAQSLMDAPDGSASRQRRSELWIGRDGRWQLLVTHATALAD